MSSIFWGKGKFFKSRGMLVISLAHDSTWSHFILLWSKEIYLALCQIEQTSFLNRNAQIPANPAGFGKLDHPRTINSMGKSQRMYFSRTATFMNSLTFMNVLVSPGK